MPKVLRPDPVLDHEKKTVHVVLPAAIDIGEVIVPGLLFSQAVRQAVLVSITRAEWSALTEFFSLCTSRTVKATLHIAQVGARDPEVTVRMILPDPDADMLARLLPDRSAELNGHGWSALGLAFTAHVAAAVVNDFRQSYDIRVGATAVIVPGGNRMPRFRLLDEDELLQVRFDAWLIDSLH